MKASCIPNEKTVTATRFAPETRNRWWHFALLAWLFATFALATPSFVNAASTAAGHDLAHMHLMHGEAMGAGQSQLPDMPAAHDHAAMKCCMVSCVATCFGTLQNGGSLTLTTVSVYLYLADDPLLRSLYLDPRVPKG